MENKTTYKYIKTIANVRSVSMAAESLGISQPALSAYLKKVEKELGTAIFDRSRQPLGLTEAGTTYIKYLDKISALDKELQHTISDMENLQTGHLSIGGASFFNISYIPKAVAAFTDAHPGISLEIVDGSVPELITAAQNGAIDIFITPDTSYDDRFIYEELLSEKIFICVPPDWEINKIFSHKTVNIETFKNTDLENSQSHYKPLNKSEFAKLCENRFIMLKEGQDIRRKMQQLIDKYCCAPKNIVVAEQTMTSLALTMAGVGISLITESSIKNCGLVNLPALYMADESICIRKMYIAYPKNKYLSRGASRFIEILKKVNR